MQAWSPVVTSNGSVKVVVSGSVFWCHDVDAAWVAEDADGAASEGKETFIEIRAVAFDAVTKTLSVLIDVRVEV